MKLPALILILALWVAGAAGADELPPLFRLPVGGRPLAPPLLDEGRAPAVVWFLSEDSSLYVLSEDARLLLKKPLASPQAWLRLDPFGRALVLIEAAAGTVTQVLPEGSAAGTVTEGRRAPIANPVTVPPSSTSSSVTVPPGKLLRLFTRTGYSPWSLDLGAWLGDRSQPDELLFGPDGRYLLRAGLRLLCLSPSGRKLWRRELPGSPSCPLILDPSGDFLVSLEDGELLRLSPYGQEVGRLGGRGLVPASALGNCRDRIVVSRRDGSLELLSLGKARARRPEGGGDPLLRLAETPDGFAGVDAAGRLGMWSTEGQSLWKRETGLAGASLYPAKGRLVLTGRGRALSFSYSGELLREATISNALDPALIAASGLLFSAGSDWVLAAYRYEGRLEAPNLGSPPFCPPDYGAVTALGLFDAAAADPDRQLRLVADIEKRLNSATIGGSEAGDRALLEAIARGSLSAAGEGASSQRLRLFALPRVEACRVLGKIGSPAEMGALAGIAAGPGDPAVRAAAFEAMAAIGVDPRGEAEGALALGSGGRRLEDEVALALVDAVESLALSTGEGPSVAALRSLIALSAPFYPSAVRERALGALALLARASPVD